MEQPSFIEQIKNDLETYDRKVYRMGKAKRIYQNLSKKVVEAEVTENDSRLGAACRKAITELSRLDCGPELVVLLNETLSRVADGSIQTISFRMSKAQDYETMLAKKDQDYKIIKLQSEKEALEKVIELKDQTIERLEDVISENGRIMQGILKGFERIVISLGNPTHRNNNSNSNSNSNSNNNDHDMSDSDEQSDDENKSANRFSYRK